MYIGVVTKHHMYYAYLLLVVWNMGIISGYADSNSEQVLLPGH